MSESEILGLAVVLAFVAFAGWYVFKGKSESSSGGGSAPAEPVAPVAKKAPAKKPAAKKTPAKKPAKKPAPKKAPVKKGTKKLTVAK